MEQRNGSGMNFAAHLPVTSSFRYVHQLLYSPGIREGFGIFHVFTGDLVQSAADCCYRLIRQYAGTVASWESINQISHSIFTYKNPSTETREKIHFWYLRFEMTGLISKLHLKAVRNTGSKPWKPSKNSHFTQSQERPEIKFWIFFSFSLKKCEKSHSCIKPGICKQELFGESRIVQGKALRCLLWLKEWRTFHRLRLWEGWRNPYSNLEFCFSFRHSVHLVCYS